MPDEKRVFQPSMILIIPGLFGSFIFAFFAFMWLIILFPLVGIALFFLILGGGAFWSYLSVKNTFVELKEEGIQVRKGIIAKSQSLFLFSQIQDITEAQGLVDQIFGIKTLSIKTMTLSSAIGGIIAGLSQEDASTIRQHALKRVSEAALKKVEKENPKVFEKIKGISEKEETFKVNPWQPHFFRGFALPYASFILVVVVLAVIGLFFSPLLLFLLGFSFYIGAAIVLWPVSVAITASAFSYRLGKTRIELVSQFLSFYRNSIPFYKVQDVIISRGLFDRVVGLSSVGIQSGEVQIVTNENKKSPLLRNVVPALWANEAIELKKYIFEFLSVNLIEKSPVLSKEFPLEGRKVIKKTVSGSIWLAIIIIILVGLIVWFVGMPIVAPISSGLLGIVGILVGLLIAIIVVTYIHQVYYLKSYYYNVTPDAILIRKGVIGSNEIIIPFYNIQNVFVDQDLLDRVFGLYDVHFSTVTMASAALSHIDGLNYENAQKLRDLIADSVAGVKK